MSYTALGERAPWEEVSLRPDAISVYFTPHHHFGRLSPEHPQLPGMILTTYEGIYPGGTRVRNRIATYTEADAATIVHLWNVQGYRYWRVSSERIPRRGVGCMADQAVSALPGRRSHATLAA